MNIFLYHSSDIPPEASYSRLIAYTLPALQQYYLSSYTLTLASVILRI